MFNRLFISIIMGGLALFPTLALAAVEDVPVCALSGEIGEGQGRITARGADRGYQGEFTLRVSEIPEVVLTVSSVFVPHKPAVDHISLSIGPVDAPGDDARLAGSFGSLSGHRFTIVRGQPDPSTERQWFEALASGATLTAAVGTDSAPVTWPAAQMEADYNYLLDLLQLVAGWEAAGLCANRSPG